MKRLIRFWSRLRSDEKRHRGIFWSVVAFSFVLGILFTYLYGNLSEYLRNRETDNPVSYRQYSVWYETESLTTRPKLPEEGVRKILESDAVESVLATCNSADGKRIYCTLKGNRYYSLAQKPKGMTDFDQLQPGEIIVQGAYPPNVGDDYTIDGVSYTVVGTGELHGVPFVTLSPEDFLRQGYQPDNLISYAAERVDYETQEEYLQNTEIGRILAAYFPESLEGVSRSLTVPTGYVSQQTDETTYRKLYFAYAFALFALSLMVAYLVDSASYDFAVERIVGAGRSRVTGLVLTEFFFLTTLPAYAGVAFHSLFSETLFAKLNLSGATYVPIPGWYYAQGELHYYAGDYLRILVLIALLHLGIALLFLARRLFATPYEMKRRAL